MVGVANGTVVDTAVDVSGSTVVAGGENVNKGGRSVDVVDVQFSSSDPSVQSRWPSHTQLRDTQ